MPAVKRLVSNLVTIAKASRKGERLGGVAIGKELHLVPSKKLTAIVEKAHKRNFEWDAGLSISPTKTQKYLNMLDEIVPGAKEAGKGLHQRGLSLRYNNGHSWTQIWNQTDNKPVVDVVEKLSNPLQDVIRYLFVR